MKPQPMRRPMDCLATAVACVLDLDALELPWTGADDWDAAWNDLRAALAERGWRLCWNPWDGEPFTVAEILADCTNDPPIEQALIWILSCAHEKFGDSGHSLVIQNGQVAFDPSPSTTPPIEELVYKGGFSLQPLDPARFVLRDAA